VYLQRFKDIYIIYNMKKIFAFGFLALVLLMTACSDKPVMPAQLPQGHHRVCHAEFPWSGHLVCQ